MTADAAGAIQDGEQARRLRAAQRLLAIREAKDDLIEFTRVTMPHPSDPDDPTKSRYDAQYFHRALAKALEEVETGRLKRLIITFPPRHGKSELTSKRFLAWYMGRDPYRHVALGTYNQTFADDYGRAVRTIMNQTAYAQVFPNVELKRDSQAADRMETKQGGALYFVGRGGSITGRGANLIIIDDPLKNSEEADSANTREDLWQWFLNDIMSRFMDDQGQAIVIQTRWHEDDLVGRLTDPKNTNYNAERAAEWKIINIPAIAEENDLLGRPVGAPLWPSRFGLPYLLNFKRDNPRGFNALYQQRPTAEEGEFFKAENFQLYGPADVPALDKMRVYMASDHAVAEKQNNDRTCILVVGVDVNDNIWVLDAYWRRAATDVVVEKLIDLIQKWKPITWWAEDDHITKSIGPFLRKRMRERKVYLSHSKVPSYTDKQKKAQAIQGRMSMNMVFFPKLASWTQDAKDELLKFPHGTHDDFADALSTVGRGLGTMIAPPKPKTEHTGPRVGSFGWVKEAAKLRARDEKRRINMASM
jgi:predicted phage terminase large subunit-like protein